MPVDPEREHLRRALALARRMRGLTHPNPTVGAVLARGGRVLAAAAHAGAGKPHAEALAIRRAGSDAKGAELFLTLEPCRHLGRTPPCTDAIVAAGIRRVVFLNRDINRQAAGGADVLRKHGVSVACRSDLPEAKAAARLNSPFFKAVYRGRPFVTAKWATSADGVMAVPGKRVWWTGEAARRFVHRLRERVDAVMVGIGTVLADDPALDCRLPHPRRQPWRVVLDDHLRTPPSARLFETAGKTMIFHAAAAGRRRARLLARGAQLLEVSALPGRLDLAAVLAHLLRMGILHVLLEAGPTLQAAMMQERLVDEVLLLVSPRLAGSGRSPLENCQFRQPRDALLVRASRLDNDVCLQYLVGAGSGLFKWEEAALCSPE